MIREALHETRLLVSGGSLLTTQTLKN
jgi:hypothetical protein